MNIHSSWEPLFNDYEFNLDEFDKLKYTYYPRKEHIFRVFEMSVDDIKICILGQDVYHGKGQAHGLAFSVERDIKIPPSLANIFKELKQEFPERNYEFKHGSLERWANEENIFLLNSALTVREGMASSHMDMWEEFTDDVIKYISEKNKSCIFVLLGNFAKAKKVFIKDKLKIVEAPHPSPLARGFIGSNVFKQVEVKLSRNVNWQN